MGSTDSDWRALVSSMMLHVNKYSPQEAVIAASYVLCEMLRGAAPNKQTDVLMTIMILIDPRSETASGIQRDAEPFEGEIEF
jgi:hypothetical protein